jgi:quinol-cytochrome oxidoreductase complex cytochrome b subunit
MRPLFGYNFRELDLQKAFFLNALAIAFVSVITLWAKLEIVDKYKLFESNESDTDEKKKINKFKYYFTIGFIGFISGILVYFLLLFLFGFGGGMLSVESSPLYSKYSKTTGLSKLLYGNHVTYKIYEKNKKIYEKKKKQKQINKKLKK